MRVSEEERSVRDGVWTCNSSYGVCTAPRVSRMHRSVSVHLLNMPNSGSRVSLFGQTKQLHTLAETGSAPLSLKLLPAEATRIPRKG